MRHMWFCGSEKFSGPGFLFPGVLSRKDESQTQSCLEKRSWSPNFWVKNVFSVKVCRCVSNAMVWSVHPNWWHSLLCRGNTARQKWAEAKALLLLALRELGFSLGGNQDFLWKGIGIFFRSGRRWSLLLRCWHSSHSHVDFLEAASPKGKLPLSDSSFKKWEGIFEPDQCSEQVCCQAVLAKQQR